MLTHQYRKDYLIQYTIHVIPNFSYIHDKISH